MYRNNEQRFYRALRALEEDPRVRQMKKYRQHRGNTTFQHCRSVALTSFRMAQGLGLRVDETALARGAMLHDFHLYTFKDRHINFLRHSFDHPKLALKNAERICRLNNKERNIIASHMWPLTPLSLPRSKEAFLVTLADKYCALREFSARRRT